MHRLDVKFRPYTNNENNELEMLSILASGITLFGGLLFTNEEGNVAVIDIIVFVMIIVLNCKFFLFFAYLMIIEIEEQYKFSILRKIKMILALILFKKDKEKRIPMPRMKTVTFKQQSSASSKQKYKKRYYNKKKKRREARKNQNQEDQPIMRRKYQAHSGRNDIEQMNNSNKQMQVVVYMPENEIDTKIQKNQHKPPQKKQRIKKKPKDIVQKVDEEEDFLADDLEYNIHNFDIERKSKKDNSHIKIMDVYELSQELRELEDDEKSIPKSSQRQFLSNRNSNKNNHDPTLKQSFHEDLDVINDVVEEKSNDNSVAIRKVFKNNKINEAVHTQFSD